MNELEYQEMKDILYGKYELQLEKQFAMKDFINNLLKNKKQIDFQSFADFFQQQWESLLENAKWETYRNCVTVIEKEFYKLPDKLNTFKPCTDPDVFPYREIC